MAKCCNPIFGDDVFGFVSATGGIKIHRISCPNAARLIEKYPYRVQKVRWKQVSNTTQFQTGLRIIGDGDASIGAQIMDCVNKQDASIRAFSISERRKPGNQTEFVAEIGISVGNNAHLDRVTFALKKIREVKTVLRTSQK
jgi:GTP pyrophosphokinase